jgi:phosphoglucomutase
MKTYDETGCNTFIFGGEESYGYLPIPFVRDKDAVAAAYFFAEMADWLKLQNKTMQDFLDEMYVKFGLFIEDLHSITIKGSAGITQIKEMMNVIRKNTPLDFAGIKTKIVKDYLTQKLIDLTDATKNADISLPKSDVLQFVLEDESIITLRPSGTEPKIKFYFSVNASVSLDNLEENKKLLRDKIGILKQALIDKTKTS